MTKKLKSYINNINYIINKLYVQKILKINPKPSFFSLKIFQMVILTILQNVEFLPQKHFEQALHLHYIDIDSMY